MRRANLAFETDVAPPDPAWPVSGGLWEGGADTLSGRIVRANLRRAVRRRADAGRAARTEASLSQRFGVSRMAIRDCCASLAAAGILDIRVGQRGESSSPGQSGTAAETLAIQIKDRGQHRGNSRRADRDRGDGRGLAAQRRPADIAGLKARSPQWSARSDPPTRSRAHQLGFTNRSSSPLRATAC